jgi:RNA polymerase primary sigma factor
MHSLLCYPYSLIFNQPTSHTVSHNNIIILFIALLLMLMCRPPTFAQWSEAVDTTVPELKKQIRRSNRAKAALIEANLRLVVSVARQTVKKNRSEINFQDACQEGIFGLTRAAEKFDPEMGFRFSTYAIWWIKKEVHRNVKDQGRTVRLPASAINKINEIRIGERVLMEELGRRPSDEELAVKVDISVKQLTFYRKSAQEVVSLDKSIVAKKGTKGSGASGTQAGKETSLEQLVTDPSQDPTKDVSAQMLKDDVRRLIKTLSPREQAVIRLRFGLDDGKPRTLDDIGKKFSVAKESIRKIEASALLKLRQPYRNKSVKCYISDL